MHPLLLTSLDDDLRSGSPAWLWALLLLLPLLWFFVDAARRRGVLLARIVAPRLQQQLTGQVSPLKRNLRTGLLLGAIALVIAGLAKPRLGYKELEIKSKGRDVIIAIDTSRSMLSTDTAPTRLGRAKLIAQDLLAYLKGDRVGLIAFAGEAFLQAPLTLDKGAVLTSLEDLDTNTIPKGGTDIASAIRMAVAAFGKGEGMSRALVLMTDGEDLEASGVEAAKEAAAAGIRIFTIGFGSPSGSLIPVRTENGRNDFVRDESGRPVTSKLDSSRLAEIAKETGGFYQAYGQDAAKAIYDKGILPLEAQETGTLGARKPIERYAWPVTAALICLTIWSLLGEGRRLRSAAPLLILALLCGGSIGSVSASGLTDYREGNYQGALKDFETRLQKGAVAEEIRFDAGAAAYKAGDYKKAAGYFSEAMTSAKRKIRDDATYNLANALVRTGEAAQETEAKLADWKNALQHYETVLKSDSGNTRAKENREIVRKLIEDLKKKQEQQKKNDKDNKKDQKDQKDQKDKQDQKEKQDQNKDQQQSDQSQGGGQGQKDQKDQKDSNDQKDKQDQKEKQDQNKDQQQKNDQQQQGQGGKDEKQDSKDRKEEGKGQQGQPTPTPTPSPSPDQGKGGSSKDEKKDQQSQPGDSSDAPQQNSSPHDASKDREEAKGPQANPSPSASPKKEGALGGGEQGKKEEGQASEAVEAEEGKDGGMSASQARALLRSVADEEQHVLSRQKRALEQTLRDW
jgi:Ca-activated chloride channel family protein